MYSFSNRLLGLLLTFVVITTSGCAAFMAAKQPGEKNESLFKIGTPRNLLLAEFGAPTVSEIKNNHKYEIYKFTQGYSSGNKAGRAVLHGVADVLTLGLWEVIGTPTEGAFNGSELAYEVEFDENDIVNHVLILKKKN